MKQILLFVLSFSFFTTFTMAQNAEFAPVGAYWKYNYYTFCGDQQRLVTVVGDTIANGKTFKKLAIDEFVDTRCPPARTSHVYSQDFLSIRNDSVFMGLNQTFLFDFKARIGDTIRFDNFFGNTIYGVVDSVGTINLGSGSRRVMYFTKYCKRQSNGQVVKYRSISKLVENFGLLTEGLIWEKPDCGMVDVSQYLFSCYGSGSFRNPANAICTPTVATNEAIDAHQITIAPNPANNDVQINYPSELHLKRVELSNYLGQTINVFSSANNQKINVLNIPNGVYLLCLQFDNQQIVKKIIVQH